MCYIWTGDLKYRLEGDWRGYTVVLVVKNLPANAGDIRNPDSITKSGRSPEKEMAIHSSILAWRIP